MTIATIIAALSLMLVPSDAPTPAFPALPEYTQPVGQLDGQRIEEDSVDPATGKSLWVCAEMGNRICGS